MLLKKIRVTNFRCIDDSEEFCLDKVTCLVGKNESGKTALLKALYRIKPDKENEKYNAIFDFPKKRWLPTMSSPEDNIVHSEWDFDDADKAIIVQTLGKNVLTNDTISIDIGYSNKRVYIFDFNEHQLVKNLIRKYSVSLDEGTSINSIDALKSIINGLEQRTESQNDLLDLLVSDFQRGPKAYIEKIIDELLPTFLYFDQYTRLPATVSISDLNAKKAQNNISDNERIFLALLDLAGTDVDKIISTRTFEEFNSSMKAVSNYISDEIFAYWSQNKHLNVEFKLDQAKPGDPSPFNQGYVFRTRINNTRHRVDTSFDERSSGFVWFFSFLIWFQRLKISYKSRLVILLDEPGLTLHARAQADLLRYINEQLKPCYQVVYTTHSPFMIDTDNILSARTVEDVVTKDIATGEEKLFGTKVSNRVLSTDPDTISPLQRALGYEITQSLFVGKNNILVEGSSDLLYLKWFSKQLEKRGKVGLDYRWTISIVNGIGKIPGYISLFQGNLLHVAAIIDVQNGQTQIISNIKASMRENHLFLVSDYVNGKVKSEADIEDVFGNEFYIGLVNSAFHLPVGYEIDYSKIKKETTKRIVNEVNDYFSKLPSFIPEFNHYLPSEYLFNIEDADEMVGFDNALASMEKLIYELNSLLSNRPIINNRV